MRQRGLPSSTFPRVSGLVLLLLLSASCGSGENPTQPYAEAVFQIRTCRGSEHAPEGELFRVMIRDRTVIRQAETLIGKGPVMIVGGPLLPGDGGFNLPWSWHLDPEKVGVWEGAIEVCDGCPSFIEADLPYWLDTVGTYCPWSSEVVSRIR